MLVTGLFRTALLSLALLFITRILRFVAGHTRFDHEVLDGELTHRLAHDVLDTERLNRQNRCPVFRGQFVEDLTEPRILRARAGTPLAALAKDPARPSRTAGLLLLARHGCTASHAFKYRPFGTRAAISTVGLRFRLRFFDHKSRELACFFAQTGRRD